MATANSMTAWQRPTSSWRTNSHPQTFSFNNEWHELHELLVTLVSFVVDYWLLIIDYWLIFLLTTNITNHTNLFFLCYVSSVVAVLNRRQGRKGAKIIYNSCYCNLIFLRVLRILWFFSSSDVTDFTDFTDVLWSQRIARIARNYFVFITWWTWWTWCWRNVLSG